jgi:aryl-alcohol dehydrogenase-like predicted oxidoreductase
MGSDIDASKGSLALMSRLALGTVQFGLAYGIANQSGQVSLAEAAKIVAQARDHGLDTLDTAIAYGESELRLGQIGISGWRIVSKLPQLQTNCHDVRGSVEGWASASLERLKISSLYGLLLHGSENLLTPLGAELYAAMQQLKAGGLVQRIGVSIYDPEELDRLGGRFPLDLVQAPFNILDRRLQASGWLARLKAQGTEVHTRSAFLQGLLLLSPDRRPSKFRRWESLWTVWDRWLGEVNLSATDACLGFPLRHPEVDRVVVGVDSTAQLAALLASEVAGHADPPPQLSSQDLDLINPSRWSSL